MKKIYKWDGTDTSKVYNFQIGLYYREESVLKRFDFEEEVSENELNEEEILILTDLETKGMIYSFESSGEIYYHGTVLYTQWNILKK